MAAQTPLSRNVRESYEAESARLKEQFAATRNGLRDISERTALIDSVVRRIWDECCATTGTPAGRFVLVGTGDLGRGTVFPHSACDLLLLASESESARELARALPCLAGGAKAASIPVSAKANLLQEFLQFDSDRAEDFVSLLDCRFLAGDRELYRSFHDRLIPELMIRESPGLVERMAELARARHRKFNNTVFHLEPDIKDAPGGLEDLVMARRLAILAALDAQRGWPEPERVFSQHQQQPAMDQALAFLASLGCFLQYRGGSNQNRLTWDAQREAAALRIGISGVPGGSGGAASATPMSPADWMRVYFRHAGAVEHISSQLLEEMPAAQSMFYRQLETWRTGFSDEDVSVVDGLIFFKAPETLSDAALLFRAFRLIAQRGFKLSPSAERQIEQARPQLAGQLPAGSAIWEFLQDVLPELHAAEALRAMHSLHLLTLFLPELQVIDSLAVRDLAHRFTVDEHTIQGIENVHALRQSKSKWDERFAGILGELDQPELLYMALLLHDTGRAVRLQDHIPASLEIARACLDRLQVPQTDREKILFLIERHLDMAAALRRDIFDPQAVAQFAESIGNPELLKMLCLFTHADLKAVNPETLTPWKAEDLWQLYLAAANYFSHSVDQRVHGDANDEVLNHLRSLAAAASGKKLQTFLEGLPRRYVRTHPVDEILQHFEMAGRLGQDPVQLALKRTRHWYELTVVMKDRPRLFATVAGALAACGMNIGKAGAFSNASGTVVDTFSFTDRFRTLELNLPAWERFKSTVHDVLLGKRELKRMLRERLEAEPAQPAGASEPPQIQFDNQCSAHSTLVEIVAADRPGLLYRISSVFSDQNCDIDIALIDTEGRTAIDVFYLTAARGKLAPEHQERLRESLALELSR